MNIVLCGMMGCGKTTTGIRLMVLTGMRCLDTDEIIVSRHGKISDIFEYYGEEKFRFFEAEVVREVAAEDNCVISTGGGCVLRTENVAALKRTGKIIYLDTGIDTLYRRAGHTGDDRPLLKGAGYDRMKSILDARLPIYIGCADFTVKTDGRTPDEVAREIAALCGVPLL